MQRFLIIALLSIPGLSCSIILDNIDIPRCDPLDEGDRRCAVALNELNGFAASCRPWRCSESGVCELVQSERCDFRDNDCDGKVDESLTEEQYELDVDVPIEFAATTLTSFTVASTDRTATATWTTDADEAQVLNLTTDDATPLQLDYVRQAEVDNLNALGLGDLTNPGDPLNCWGISFPSEGQPVDDDQTVLQPPELAPQACDFRRVASALQAGTGLVASVSGRGCVHGQLRVGFISEEDQRAVAIGGSPELSNAILGVALSHDGKCTGTQPDACTAARLRAQAVERGCSPACNRMRNERCIEGTCYTGATCPEGNSDFQAICGNCYHIDEIPELQECGVRAVQVAASAAPTFTFGSSASADSFMVAMLGGSQEVECNDVGVRDVGVLGVRLNSMSAGGWLTTTGDPLVLNPTTSREPPSLLAVPGQGSGQGKFLLAYPGSEDSIQLYVLGPVPNPEEIRFPEVELSWLPHDETAPDGVAACCGDVGHAIAPETNCGSDEGVCISGRQRCSGGEYYCEGIRRSSPEVCENMLDDDCDGLLDESSETTPCLETAPSEPERCNARDDDQDGMVDEGLGDLGACGGNLTESGNPQCRPSPSQTCTMTSECDAGMECVGSRCTPTAETGACQRGTLTCLGGEEICVGAVNPRTNSMGNCQEFNDGVDDDCDGNVDENAVDCTASGREICNDRDDDCDGMIDEDGCSMRMMCGGDDECEGQALTYRADDVRARGPELQRPPFERRICLPDDELPTPDVTSVDGSLGIGDITEVILAGGYWKDDELTIGMIWREESGDPEQQGQAAVGFRTLTFAQACERCTQGERSCEECTTDNRRFSELGDLIDVGAPVDVSGLGFIENPSIVFVERGIRVSDEDIADDEPSIPDELGGWYVAWVQGMNPSFQPWEVVARPIAASDGQPLFDCPEDSDVCGYSLPAGPMNMMASPESRARFVRLFVINNVVRFAYPVEDDGGNVVVTGRLSCKPTARSEE